MSAARELAQSIRAYVDAHPAMTMLPVDEAEHLRLAVAQAFNLPTGKRWWWECVPAIAVSTGYRGDDISDWRDRMLEALPEDGQPLWLFVTDDELPPWACVTGSRKSLIDMIMQLQYVEYFVVNRQHTRIVFDTHHNRLIVYERTQLLIE